MQPVLIKIYGYLRLDKAALQPALERLRTVAAACSAEAADAFCLSGRLIQISFEGAFFPEEEIAQTMLDLISSHFAAQTQSDRTHSSKPDCSKSDCPKSDYPEFGRLDCLDLEAWQLRRYSFDRRGQHMASAPLNNVLDYSGF